MKETTIAIILVASLLIGCGQKDEQAAVAVEDWRTSTPEEQGIDSRPLLAMLTEIQERDLRIDSVLVVRNGYLVLEAYLPPYQREHRHIIYSATKSVSALLAGLAIDDGLIPDVNEQVLGLLPHEAEGVENLDEWKRKMTLRDLLTMTSGFEWEDGPYGIREPGDFSRLLASSEPVRYILDKPMSHEPGTHFNYNSGCSHLLSAIVQEASGKTALEYANEKLFHPLGIEDADWSEYQGINNGGSELFLRPREMAKVGFLMLNQGRWGAEQIIPAEWVSAALQQYVQTDVEFTEEGYGYQWFTKDFAGHMVHSAEGMGGNFIFVIPDLDMVVVFTGGLTGRRMVTPYLFLEDTVLPAARSSSPLPPNPDLTRSLEDLAEDVPDTEVQATELPEIVSEISGSTFDVTDGENVLGIEQVSIAFPQNSEARMTIVYSGTGADADWGLDVVFRRDVASSEKKEVEVVIGLDNRFRTIVVDHDEIGKVPFSAKGRWEDNSTLVLTVLSAWAIPETWTLSFREDDSPTLRIKTSFLQTELELN